MFWNIILWLYVYLVEHKLKRQLQQNKIYILNMMNQYDEAI